MPEKELETSVHELSEPSPTEQLKESFTDELERETGLTAEEIGI